MIVKCPHCGNCGECNKKETGRLRCNRCDAIFDIADNRLNYDASARIWRVRGISGLPVSLRVLKYRLSAGSLSINDEVSSDGKEWRRISGDPDLLAYLGTGKGRSRSKAFFEEQAVSGQVDLMTPGPRRPNTHTKGQVVPDRSKKTLVIVSFALIIASVFFFPIYDMRTENAALKENLTRAEKKITEIELKLSSMMEEFGQIKNVSEEFKRTKAILEDIKKSIDSNSIYLVVSLADNGLFVKIGARTLKSYVVSTGKGKTVLKTTGKTYNFLTPRGKMIIQFKQRNPVWIKPDWVWLEKGMQLPTSISIQDRIVKGQLGKYRLQMGNGYSIHGTRNGEVNGKKETHGCIRVARRDLKELYAMVEKGTEVYIY